MLGPTKEQLEALIRNENLWAGRATLVLAIGIVGEYVIPPFFKQHDKPPLWQKLMKAFFAVLVVVGIVGEYRYSSEIAGNADELQQLADAEVVQSGKDVKLALDKSTDASNRAVAAESQLAAAKSAATKAELDAHNADAKAEGFRLQIAKANERASRAQKDAETERLARVKIEKQLAPRFISDPDRKSIGKDLKRFASSFAKRKVKISSFTGDAEGQVFSLEIMDIVTRAGIDVDPAIGRVWEIGGIVYQGVKITGPVADQEFMKRLGTDIWAHCQTRLNAEWDPKYNDVTVLVGVKPVPGLPAVSQAPTK